MNGNPQKKPHSKKKNIASKLNEPNLISFSWSLFFFWMWLLLLLFPMSYYINILLFTLSFYRFSHPFECECVKCIGMCSMLQFIAFDPLEFYAETNDSNSRKCNENANLMTKLFQNMLTQHLMKKKKQYWTTAILHRSQNWVFAHFSMCVYVWTSCLLLLFFFFR